jgi:hypothetical protein
VVAADLLNERRLELAQRYPHGGIGVGAWALAALCVLAAAQAGYIAFLLYSPAPAMVIEVRQPVDLTAAGRNTAGPSTIDMLPLTNAQPAAATDREMRTPEPVRAVAAPAAARSGGVRLISQIEVQLLDGDRVLGSSGDGAIVTTAGRHEFELVNSTLGYRSRQVVDIKPGEVVSLAVAHPEGRISINAVPWADVWIDGTHIGETPLANLSVPIGQHEVEFRHPAFGEQKRSAIVRFDVPTRLSADFR